MYEDSDVVKIESKIRNIRFLGELTKFGVCPSMTVLECLKKCLDDFNAHNIELTYHLLDTCGIYLSRATSSDSGDSSILKFKNLLEILQRRKDSKFSSFIEYFLDDNISSKSLINLETAI